MGFGVMKMHIVVDGPYAVIDIFSGYMKGKYILRQEINLFFLVKTRPDLHELDYFDNRMTSWKPTYKTNFTTILGKALKYIEDQEIKKMNETGVGYING